MDSVPSEPVPSEPIRIESRGSGVTSGASALAANSPPTKWTINLQHQIECLDGFDAWMRRIEKREEEEDFAAAHRHCSGCRACYRRVRQDGGSSKLSQVEFADELDSISTEISALNVETTKEAPDKPLTFHRFADLPTELRLRVWVYALDNWWPRFLSVDILPGDRSDPLASQVWRPTPTATNSLVAATRWSRALLTCCRESRYELLQVSLHHHS